MTIFQDIYFQLHDVLTFIVKNSVHKKYKQMVQLSTILNIIVNKITDTEKVICHE